MEYQQNRKMKLKSQIDVEKTKKRNHPCKKNGDTLLDMCVSSLRRGHANLLCIVPILADDPPEGGSNSHWYWRLIKGRECRSHFYSWVKKF